MARPRPELAGWAGERLQTLEGSSPREWVSTVLSTLWVSEADVSSGRLARWYKSWTFGQVREAIRREIERRGATPSRAASLASLRAARGLKELEAEGAVLRRRGAYRLTEALLWANASCDAIRMCAESLNKPGYRLTADHTPQKGRNRGRVAFKVTRKGKRVPLLEIAWSV